MYEKLFRVRVGNQEYPLLYTLQASAEFDEHYVDIVEDVDYLRGSFSGPEDADGDTPEERKSKKKERQKALIFFKSELPWLISTLAKYGLKAAAKAGETNLPKPPTEQWILDNAWPGQQAGMIMAFDKAYLYGRLLTHTEGENKAVDVVLRALEAKNGEGAAE